MAKLEGPLPVGLSVFDVATDKDFMVMGTGQLVVGDDPNSNDTVPSVTYQDSDGNVFTMREDYFRDRYALLTVERNKAVTQSDGPKIPQQKVDPAPTSNKQPDPASSDANKPSGTAPPAPSSSKGTVGTKSTENR